MNATNQPAPADRDALDRFWRYHEADPGNTTLLRDIASRALASGQLEDGVRALDVLAAQGQSDPNDEAAAIHVLLKLGRIEQACARAAKAHQTWPDDEAVRLEGARALFNARRAEEALAWLTLPFTEPSLAQMGGEISLQALWHLGQLEEAVSQGAVLLAQWPGNPRLLALQSALFYDLERAEEAFDAAQRAYAISPAHAYQALHVLASQCLLRQDLDGAFKLVEQAQQQRTDDGRIWLIKASARLMAGQHDEAILDLKRTLEIFPDHPGSHLTLAWVHVTRNQLDEAEAVVRTAIDASPAFAESHGTLAVVLAKRGQVEEAQQSIRRATLLDKNSFAARYAQAVLDGTPPERVEELFKLVLRRSGLR